MKRTAILVTGSRNWVDYKPIRDRLALYPEGTILLHGDCGRLAPATGGFTGKRRWVGADKIAHDIGYGRFNIWPLPYFDDLGKAGGPRRNKCLLKILSELQDAGFACSVEAFPIGESRGTRGCIEEARKYAEHVRPWPIHVTEGDL